METTVNKECDNYMKQMFNTCENGYRIFYIIFPEICRSYKIVPKALYVKKKQLHWKSINGIFNNWWKEKLD